MGRKGRNRFGFVRFPVPVSGNLVLYNEKPVCCGRGSFPLLLVWGLILHKIKEMENIVNNNIGFIIIIRS